MYIEMSSGRYTVNGDVSDWVQVPYNAASYGSNYCGDIVCQDTWRFVNDAANAVRGHRSRNTAAQIAYLADFDVWDRYDHDGDGNFDEPDGYIDHYQTVHAGEGEETAAAPSAPTPSGATAGMPGSVPTARTAPASTDGAACRSATPTTGSVTTPIEPEDGGVGVFAHEFAHDLNLPDLYDTSGNTGGAENSTGFWTLMSSGSNTGTGEPEDGIGGHPTHMGNWEKFQLGWLNYEVAFAGVPSSHRLGPPPTTPSRPRACSSSCLTTSSRSTLGPPCATCGTQYFYSGSGDNLNIAMTKTGTTGTALTAKVRYTIEEDWDYAFLEASTNGGTSWTPVATNRSDTSGDQSGINPTGTGITGAVRSGLAGPDGHPAGGHERHPVRLSDGRRASPSRASRSTTSPSTARSSARPRPRPRAGPSAAFRITTGSETQAFFNAYVLENRQYTGYDVGLRDGVVQLRVAEHAA